MSHHGLDIMPTADDIRFLFSIVSLHDARLAITKVKPPPETRNAPVDLLSHRIPSLLAKRCQTFPRSNLAHPFYANPQVVQQPDYSLMRQLVQHRLRIHVIYLAEQEREPIAPYSHDVYPYSLPTCFSAALNAFTFAKLLRP
jgi:hypothetical protein